MNLKEAYSILEIPQSSTPEEAKKKYRELTKKYHPDINKEAGAEDKFKKINEAYQVVSSGKGTDREEPQYQSREPFNPFGGAVQQELSHIEMSTTISFKDSILGAKKELKFNRKTKCTGCNGQGEIPLDNGCDKCKGRGQIMSQQGGMIMVQTCPKCYGRRKANPCNTCNTAGVLDAEATITVTIPGGIHNGNILRVGGMGNYAGSFGPMDQHTDLFLHLKVTPEDGLSLVDRNVVSHLQISLLEALKGCQKRVKTVKGFKDVSIKAKSRNKEEVIIPHVGVNGQGSQRVILDVQYPEHVDQLINVLSEKGKE